MAFSFMPKEVKFFDLFDLQASNIVKAGITFQEIISKGSYSDAEVQKMRDIEHECDNVTHDIIDKLNRTFITPFDREDIHALAKEIDDVVDMLYAITKKLKLYRIKKVDQALIEFSDIIVQSIGCLTVALNGLRDSKNPQTIQDCCIEINRLENVGDQLRDNAIGKLFDKSKDPIHVIKWKEIYEEAETVLDICEDVANVIESILVKQA